MSSTRLHIAAALVAATFASVLALGAGGKPRSVTPFPKDVTAIPERLGNWTGKRVEQDPRIIQVAGAEASADYEFRDAARHLARVSIAWWSDDPAAWPPALPPGTIKS